MIINVVVTIAIGRKAVATLCRYLLFLHNGAIFPNENHLIVKYAWINTYWSPPIPFVDFLYSDREIFTIIFVVHMAVSLQWLVISTYVQFSYTL